jgi:pyruvate dehydrogenase complex dehydrogenase (E1) component
MPEALRAADLLAEEWDAAADVWSVTSWGELNRDGVEIEKERLRYPERPARTPFVTTALADAAGPVVAVSDWMRGVSEQIRPWVPGTYVTVGTDGFGFSDTRPRSEALLQYRRRVDRRRRPRGPGPRREHRPVGRGRGGPQVPDRRCDGRARADLRLRSGTTPRR